MASNRKYNPAQKAALDMLSAVHSDRVQAKATLEMRLRAELEDALQNIRLKESRAANECLSLKVAKSDIARALGTSNWDTLKNTFALTAGDFTADDFNELNKRYTLNDDNTITVTLTTDEVLWEQDNYMDVKNRNVPHGGTFEKHPVGGWRYKKQDGDPTFQIEGHVNPLTYWSRRAENIKELTEWAEGKEAK